MALRIAFHADAERAAEDYLLQRMRADQVQAYEFHISRCSTCASELLVTRTLIQAIRLIADEEAEFRVQSWLRRA